MQAVSRRGHEPEAASTARRPALKARLKKRAVPPKVPSRESFHDFQPAFLRDFHREAVPAVRHAVQMQSPCDGHPAGAADDPAEEGGKEKGRKEGESSDQSAHHNADQRKPCGNSVQVVLQGPRPHG